MKVKKLFEYRKIIPIVIAAAGIYMSVRYSAECSRGILNGILFCVEALVPSLFIFMAVSAYAVKSGAAVTVSKPFGKISKALFGLPYPSLAVIIMSVIGGYPVGARCAAMMYDEHKLSREQAEKTVYIAICAGPGFLINFVGRALLGSAKAGYILLAAETVSVILTGIMAGRIIKCKTDIIYDKKANNKSGNLLISAVNDAAASTMRMCAMVIICSAMIEVITEVSPDKSVTDIVSAITEITTGCGILCGRYPLWIIAFFIGFGGISVHLQIFASIDKLTVNKGLFFVFRIIQGIICAAVTYILVMIFPFEISVFNSTEQALTISKSATLAGSAALIICAVCFLGTIRKTERELY